MNMPPIIQAASACNVCLKDKTDSCGDYAFVGCGEKEVLIIGDSPTTTSYSWLITYALMVFDNADIFDFTYRRRCEASDILSDIPVGTVREACDVYTNLMALHYKLVVEVDSGLEAFTDPTVTDQGYTLIKIPMNYVGPQKNLIETITTVLKEKEDDDS